MLVDGRYLNYFERGTSIFDKKSKETVKNVLIANISCRICNKIKYLMYFSEDGRER